MTDFFILAGGLGKRAAPLTRFLPKTLFPLDGIPLIKLLGEQLLRNRFNKGFINVHHLAPMIMTFPLSGLEVTYLEEKILSGNRILSECSDKTTNDLFVINGDTFMDIPFSELLRAIDNKESDGAILVRKKDGPYSSIVARGDRFYKRDQDPYVTDVMYAGVSIFRNEFLSKLTEENLFDSLERSEGKILIVEYSGFWLDLGTPANYFLSNEKFRKFRGIKNGNSFSEDVIVSGDAEVINSIVWSNTVISGNAAIRDSIITGGLTIDRGSFTNRILTREGEFALDLPARSS